LVLCAYMRITIVSFVDLLKFSSNCNIPLVLIRMPLLQSNKNINKLASFWPNVLINIWKKQKQNRKKNENLKECILDIFASFSAFSMFSQKNLNFKDLLNVFDFNASLSKLLIFLIWIEVDIICFQNKFKIPKTKKKLNDQFGNLATFCL
jgi:hypothetical protein